jgi:hypothetical protein
MQKILGIAVLLMMAFACTRTAVTAPDFNVTLNSTTYKAGDTVYFTFSGNPDFVTFYPGDSAHAYKNRERFTAAGTPQLQFSSLMATGTQDSTLHVMISTDFAGPYDSTSIYQAHWADITARAVLSTGGTTSTPSGIIDLSDYGNDGKPVYLAFKYLGFKTASAQRTWTIPTFSVINLLKEENTNMPVAGTLGDGGWIGVNMKDSVVKWSVSATQLQIKGGAANSNETEDWVISKGLSLNKAVADVGLPVKNISANKVKTYYYIYNKPGTYTATFAVSNTTVYDNKSGVKELQITVTP